MRKFNEKNLNLKQKLGQIFCVKNLNLRQSFKLFFSEKSLISKQIFCEIFYLKKLNLQKLVGLFVLPFAFNACSLMPTAQPNPTTYILKADESVVLERESANDKSIQIAPTQSLLYLKGDEIAYVINNELSAYSKHLWKSSPTNSLALILAEKFEKNRLFKAVLNSNSQIRADLLLETRFDAFEQVFVSEEEFDDELKDKNSVLSEGAKRTKIRAKSSQSVNLNTQNTHLSKKASTTTSAKSYIRLELSASLVENESKTLLGFERFSYKIPVQDFTPDSAIISFDKALNLLGDDMVEWLDELLK